MENVFLMKRVFAFIFVLAVVVPFGFSQAGTGSVSGTVMDPTHAVVPNAKVVLSNSSTGLSRTAMTDNSGNYRFTSVPVGPGYDVRVTTTGFSASEAKGITTTVGDAITEDFTLQAGGESTTVEVGTTNEEQVQVESSAVSQVIDSTVWQDSPLEVRSQNTFVGLTAGAASDGGTGRGYGGKWGALGHGQLPGGGHGQQRPGPGRRRDDSGHGRCGDDDFA